MHNIVRLASYHIRNIGRISKYLDKSVTGKAIHANALLLAMSTANDLLCRLPNMNISRLQRLQNTAARIVTLP